MKPNINIIIAAIRTYIRNKKGKKFEPEIVFLKDLLNKGENCFHIGASDARHSYVMSQLVEDGQIYAFEPSSYSYQHLVLMKKLHRLKNINTYRLAVSDKPGVVTLVTPRKSTGHAGRSFAYITGRNNSDVMRSDINATSSIKEEVKAISVDQFTGQNDLKKVDFIRCDTEGSEMLILKGAQQTIENFKPNLLIEIHSDALKNVFNSSAGEVTNFLFKYGYFMFREDEGRINKVNSVDESERWKDYFFIHPDRINNLPEGPFKEQLR